MHYAKEIRLVDIFFDPYIWRKMARIINMISNDEMIKKEIKC